MGHDSIDRILASRRTQEVQSLAPESEDNKFFSILIGDGFAEHFFELRFRKGLKTCFSYTDLQWFNYDPEEGCIDLEFGGFLVTIKGRGLGEKLFQAIKQKRIAWVKECDSEMQDHKGIDTFIEAIMITPPRGTEEDASAAA